jgi:polyisoprenoid-binding protein YceI
MKMKKLALFTVVTLTTFSLMAFTHTAEKMKSTKSHISFFSTTPVEDIQANNYKAVSSIDPSTGDVVFSIPMQSFEFEKSTMQKHFNSDKFLDTKAFPKAKLKGKITNISDIAFDKDGTYDAEITGELTIKGVTNTITEKGTVTVKGNKVKVNSKFTLNLADYKITFEKGKPSTNIAKTVEVTVVAEY